MHTKDARRRARARSGSTCSPRGRSRRHFFTEKEQAALALTEAVTVLTDGVVPGRRLRPGRGALRRGRAGPADRPHLHDQRLEPDRGHDPAHAHVADLRRAPESTTGAARPRGRAAPGRGVEAVNGDLLRPRRPSRLRRSCEVSGVDGQRLVSRSPSSAVAAAHSCACRSRSRSNTGTSRPWARNEPA